jgi:hypothetical protein
MPELQFKLEISVLPNAECADSQSCVAHELSRAQHSVTPVVSEIKGNLVAFRCSRPTYWTETR